MIWKKKRFSVQAVIQILAAGIKAECMTSEPHRLHPIRLNTSNKGKKKQELLQEAADTTRADTSDNVGTQSEKQQLAEKKKMEIKD